MNRIFALGAFLVVSAIVLNAQTPTIIGVLDSPAGQARIAPGARAAIYGSNLGPSVLVTSSTGVTVLFNNRPAFVIFAQASQLLVQVPVELTAGPATVTVSYQGRTSAPFPLTLIPFAPSLTTLDVSANGAGTFLHTNLFAVDNRTPARPGEILTAYAFGLGPTIPAVPTGQPAPPALVAATTPGTKGNYAVVEPTMKVGGKTAGVIFAGLFPLEIGIYKVNFVVPGDLTPGLYPVVLSQGNIDSNAVLLPVGITGLVLDHTGLIFDAVEAGVVPPVQTVGIVNGGGPYTLTASTTSGGSWLSVNPSSGNGNFFLRHSVKVDPTNLRAGTYYGQIKVSSPGADNSPQLATVVFRVAPSTAPPVPLLSDAGLTFVDVFTATSAKSQNIQITNLGLRTSTFTASITTTDAKNPFSTPVTAGSLNPGQTAAFAVQANAAGLTPGVYRAVLTLNFPLEGGKRTADLLLVVTAAAVTPAAGKERETTAACKPTKLSPVFRALGQNFSAPASFPASVEVSVLDDCGTPMTTGSVVASFSNGDVPISLVGDGTGRWSATWTPINVTTASTAVTATAVQSVPALTGQAQLTGLVTANSGVPAISAGGVLNAASFSRTATPSPGEIVVIFGNQLGDGLVQASNVPLPTVLGGTEFILGGTSLPLIYTSPTQAAAIMPYGLKAGSTYQLIASRGLTLSTPVSVAVTAGEPGVFTTDGSGTGQGHVYVATPEGLVLADSSRPVKQGDVLVMYCAGLGEVNPTAEAGSATPADALRNARNTVSVTIGGVAAAVGFAGLTPGSTGLYQINATVPPGVPSGAALVRVSVGDLTGAAVTIAAQ